MNNCHLCKLLISGYDEPCPITLQMVEEPERKKKLLVGIRSGILFWKGLIPKCKSEGLSDHLKKVAIACFWVSRASQWALLTAELHLTSFFDVSGPFNVPGGSSLSCDKTYNDGSFWAVFDVTVPRASHANIFSVTQNGSPYLCNGIIFRKNRNISPWTKWLVALIWDVAL